MSIIPWGISIHGYLSCCNSKRSWSLITNNPFFFTKRKGTPATYGCCTCVVVRVCVCRWNEICITVRRNFHLIWISIKRFEWNRPHLKGKVSNFVLTAGEITCAYWFLCAKYFTSISVVAKVCIKYGLSFYFQGKVQRGFLLIHIYSIISSEKDRYRS